MLIVSKTGGFDGTKTYKADEVVDVNPRHALMVVRLGHGVLVNADGEPLTPDELQKILTQEA